MIPEIFIAAYLAGLLSFLAPCLIPLLPSYFSIITGFTFSDLYGLDFGKIRSRVFISSLFFVLGFSLVYTILGATGAVAGKILDIYLGPILRLSGLFLILLGSMQLGIIKFPALRFDFAWNIQRRLARLGYITAVATGVAAALSWIPCVGPLLSPILLLSAKSDTVWQGAILLFVYSIGLTTPFLIIGLFFPTFVRRYQERKLFFRKLSQIAGIFLILFGFVLLIDKYNYILDIYYGIFGYIQTPSNLQLGIE